MKAHSEKYMNVSDMQAPDEDDRHDEQSRNNTIKANNKIVNERIWIISVTSKIMMQPLDADTDARLHEESVISVRIQAEIGISSADIPYAQQCRKNHRTTP